MASRARPGGTASSAAPRTPTASATAAPATKTRATRQCAASPGATCEEAPASRLQARGPRGPLRVGAGAGARVADAAEAGVLREGLASAGELRRGAAVPGDRRAAAPCGPEAQPEASSMSTRLA